MAAADYRLCDVCDRKVFYDSNLNYGWSCEDESEFPFRTNGEPQYGERKHQMHLDYLGDWAVICATCAQTHKTVVVPITPPTSCEDATHFTTPTRGRDE